MQEIAKNRNTMKRKPCCILFVPLIFLLLTGCDNNDTPVSRDSEEESAEFVVAKAELLDREDLHPFTAYTLGLTSTSGDYVTFRLLANSLTAPTGKFMSSDKKAHGAISGLRFSGKSNTRDRATGLFITLNPSLEDYSFTGTLTLATGSEVKISGSAPLTLKPDKKSLVFSTLLSQVESSDGLTLEFNGNDSYKLSVSFAGISLPSDLTDGDYPLGANKLTVSLACPSLPRCSGGETFDAVIEIKSGTLHAVLNGNVLGGRFESDSFDIAFTLELPGDKKDDKEYTMLPGLLSVSRTGSDFISLKLAQEGIEMIYDEITWQTRYKGTGLLLSLEIYAKDGVLSEGKYTISTQEQPMTFRAGWNPGDIYNIGVEYENWGTCLYDLSESGTAIRHITDGIVTVTRDEGTYSIRLVNSIICAAYTGPVHKPEE